jgi:hypothetical protein
MTGKKRSMELLNVGDEDQLKKKRMSKLFDMPVGTNAELLRV